MGSKYSIEEAEARIKGWCDRQERSHFDVRKKLAEWKIYYDDADQILVKLIDGNYLNELRFAKAYVSGKFRIKRWGKGKIVQGLKGKKISEYCIKEGLKEIDEEEYLKTLKALKDKKFIDYKGLDNFRLKGKTANYLVGRGYEVELVWKVVKEGEAKGES